MVVFGILLLLIGFIAGISVLVTIGVILVVLGLILNFVPLGGGDRRRRYW